MENYLFVSGILTLCALLVSAGVSILCYFAVVRPALEIRKSDLTALGELHDELDDTVHDHQAMITKLNEAAHGVNPRLSEHDLALQKMANQVLCLVDRLTLLETNYHAMIVASSEKRTRRKKRVAPELAITSASISVAEKDAIIGEVLDSLGQALTGVNGMSSTLTTTLPSDVDRAWQQVG